MAGAILNLLSLAAAQPVRITKIAPAPKRYVTRQTTQYKADSLHPLTLRFDQNNLFIYFEGGKKGEKYVYRLDKLLPYDISTANDFAFFSNVPSGEYEFSVRRESDPSGLTAKQKLVLELPVWLRWWFLPMLFAYSLVFISVIIYFIFKYRYRQQLRIFQVREHVARDLHDDMGSQLSSISILSQNLEQMAQQNPDLARHYLARIGETARQVMDSMSDIVWSVNPEKDGLPHMAERMQAFASELFETSATELHFYLDPELLKTTLELTKRHDFYMIFKEALTNAARYAQATTVAIRLERKQGMLHLSIQDDGVGFDPDHPPRSQGGNGLRNMRARAGQASALRYCLPPPKTRELPCYLRSR